MAHAIGENHARRRLAAGELVLCMGVNQLRSPNIALIAAACGFDAIYLGSGAQPDVARNRRVRLRRRARGRGHADRAHRLPRRA